MGQAQQIELPFKPMVLPNINDIRQLGQTGQAAEIIDHPQDKRVGRPKQQSQVTHHSFRNELNQMSNPPLTPIIKPAPRI